MEPQSHFTPVRWYQTLDSTNNESKRHLEALDNLSVISAVEQTAGRGRGSHTWVAKAGENLTFSLILKFSTPAGSRGQAVLAASEAVRITHYLTVVLCNFLEEEGLSPRIKWPNDIWVADKKISGVLVENTFSGGCVESSIIGIGLNLNQKVFDPDLPNPTSLALLTGRSYEPVETLDRLYKEFRRLAEELDSESGRARLELEFSRRMFVLEKPLQDRITASIGNFEAKR